MSSDPILEGDFRTFLPGLGRLMPSSLLDAHGCERLVERTGDLPGLLTATQFGLEIRLDDSTADADFALPLWPDTQLADYFVRLGETDAPRSPAAAALARRLRRADGFGSVFEDFAMLEFDIASARPGTCSSPGIFLKPRREPGMGMGTLSGRVVDALTMLAGREPDGAERPVVERAFAALPANTSIIHVGVLPDRTPRSIRLVVMNIDVADVTGFLTRMEHPDPAVAQSRIPSALLGLCDPRCWLGLDVSSDGVFPRIGLEFRPPADGTDRQLGNTLEQWWPVIDWLEQAGWCRSGKARGLRNWIRKDTLFHGRHPFLLFRGISHIKIVIDGDATSAKAYVTVAHVPAGWTNEALSDVAFRQFKVPLPIAENDEPE